MALKKGYIKKPKNLYANMMFESAKRIPEDKKPYFIKEPFGIPFELTEKDKFRKPKRKR